MPEDEDEFSHVVLELFPKKLSQPIHVEFKYPAQELKSTPPFLPVSVCPRPLKAGVRAVLLDLVKRVPPCHDKKFPLLKRIQPTAVPPKRRQFSRRIGCV